MTDQEIRNIIRQEIATASASSRFQLAPNTRHIHNGADSPYAYNPNQVYAGIIVTSDQPSTLPTGWSLEYLGTGETNITHNLGDFDQVMWFATPIGAGGATIPVPIVVGGLNVTTFSWFDVSAVGGGAPVDTTFYFVAVQVNNKNTSPVQYTVFS